MTSAAVSPFPVARQAPAGWKYLDYPTKALLIQATTKWEKGFRAEACAKEPWTVTWIEAMQAGRDVLWNVGANVGSYALIAGSRGIPTMAIEPGYASFAALCNNVLANRLERLITPICAALALDVDVTPLAYRSTEAGAASHAFGSTDAPKAVGTLPTLTLSLDMLDLMVKLRGAPRPTHLLIDVDGAEALVLRGGSVVLTEHVRSVMIEVQHDLAEEIGSLLASFGYAERERFTERKGLPLGQCWYAIFERG